MNRKFLIIWNAFFFSFMILQIISAVMLYFSILYELFFRIHIINGILLFIFFSGHLILNRGWIKALFKKK